MSDAPNKEKVLDLRRRTLWLIESRKCTIEEACAALTSVLKTQIDNDETPPDLTNFLVLRIITGLLGPRIEEEIQTPTILTH